MKNLILLTLIGLIANYNLSNKKISVVERTEAMLIKKGYVILTTDSVFEFRNNKYLIKTREFFNEKGELNHASLWSEMGYEYWPKKDIDKHFLNDYNFSPNIDAQLVDNRHLKINENIGLIKGRDEMHKMIYYNFYKNKSPNKIIYLFRIVYK